MSMEEAAEYLEKRMEEENIKELSIETTIEVLKKDIA